MARDRDLHDDAVSLKTTLVDRPLLLILPVSGL